MSNAKNPIQAVQRTLDIVDYLRNTSGAGVTDIADKTGISKGTVHCHLATLKQNGYVIKDGNEYKLGLRFVDLAYHAKNRIDIYNITTTEVDTLAEDTGEMALFTVEEEGKGICMYIAEGENAVQTEAYVGYRNDLYHTAVGKAILAFLTPEKRDRIIENIDLKPITENTITDEERLCNELKQIRQDGIAYNYEESIPGLVGVGVPIRGQDDVVHGAVSVIGPVRRMGEERLKNEIPNLLQRAVNIIEINITSL